VFVIGHLVGNLQLFSGRNAQPLRHFLQSNKEIPLAGALGLLALRGPAHFCGGAPLGGEQGGRGRVGYEGDPNPIAASYASRTMLMSGIIIAAFTSITCSLHCASDRRNFSGQDFLEGFTTRKGRTMFTR